MAQPIPLIPTTGKSVCDFTPSGWFIKEAAFGDLNNDGYRDAAVVIQCSDSANILHNDGLGAEEIDTNRRILLILLIDAETENFTLHTQSNTFILNHKEPIMDDPFDDVTIEKGTLHIRFHIWQSAGSWWTDASEYKFQYRDFNFVLIGAESTSYNRGSGESETESYNFLTKKKKSTRQYYAEEYEVKEKGGKVPDPTVRWENLSLSKLKTFQTFIAPYTWDEGNIQL